jgi:hypothetical protein
MSEYQYYEFLALDRPLDDRQQAEVRSLSTRASITATSFINEYHWGNFRGDPNRMMERYYDAHLYLTNWGTHRIMLRLPGELLDIDIDVVEDHCVGDQVTVWATGEFLVLDMTSGTTPVTGSTTPREGCQPSSEPAPNSPPVTSGRSISPGWPAMAPGNEMRTPSTASRTTSSSHLCRPD